jgi:subtilisin family serine protease
MRRWVGAGAALLLLLSLVVSVPAAQAATSTGTVTLITSDVVETRPDGSATVRPGPGREHVRFLIRGEHGHHLVVLPSDVLPLVGSGALDPRLFDVSTLLSMGYGDAQTRELPLIVAGSALARTRVGAAGGTVTQPLAAVDAVAVRAAKRDTGRLWPAVRPGAGDQVSRIWLDGRRRLSLDHSTAQIGAPRAWESGLTGQGVTVAVLDSGVDATHPDFAGRIVEASDFTGAGDSSDEVGHGTHVASILAGSGAASGGRYRGVAPEASLLVGKVCQPAGCPESAILAGMQWAVERAARVVNMSFGYVDSEGIDPIEQAIDTLSSQHGTLFVVAAGNDGQLGEQTLSSPATADAALAVGAVDGADQMAAFSSRGPRVGDHGLKPDIVAPGVGIVAAYAVGTVDNDGVVDDRYARMSGTSMAAPHVAGAAALLAQQHPTWAGGQLKAALTGSAMVLPGTGVFAQGAGRLDVARAVTQQVVTETASLGFGVQRWPHGDDQPVTRTVTYRNAGDTPVTLELSGGLARADDDAAPSGMFRLSASRLTVPAGGAASVTATVDTRVNAPDGMYTGRIRATAGDLSLTVPMAVDREVESYDLTLQAVGRDGAPAGDYEIALSSWAENTAQFPYDPDGTVVLRLPRGDYTAAATILTGSDTTIIAQPRLALTRDTTVSLDARRARPVEVSVPDPKARFSYADVLFNLLFPQPVPNIPLGVFWEGGDFTGIYTGQLGDAAPQRFLSSVDAVLTGASGATYHLAWFEPGGLQTGLTRHVRPADLAAVQASYQGPPGRTGLVTPLPTTTDGRYGGWWAPPEELTLPARRIEYYTADPDVAWSKFFVESAGRQQPTESLQRGEQLPYRAGSTERETWNAGVFGPALPARNPAGRNWVTRTGDVINVDLGLFADGSGRHGSMWRAATDSARTALYQEDGTLVATSPVAGHLDAPVPAGTAGYRLAVEADRSGSAEVSTRVDAVWTFRSGHVDGWRPAALPLLAVRFAPRLDQDNAAPAGRAYRLPISVQQQPGSDPRSVMELHIDVSYDDGAHWATAGVTRAVDGWVATLDHPAAGGFVSLRAHAEDSEGGTVDQTIIRAYRLATT